MKRRPLQWLCQIVLLALLTACGGVADAPSGESVAASSLTAEATSEAAPSEEAGHEDEAEHTDEEEHADAEHEGEAHDAAELPDLAPLTLAAGRRLRVLATTSIVGDVVSQVAGDNVDLTVLMEPGQDPHSYQSTASDLALASEADVIFVNGFDLEEGLLADLENAAPDVPIVPVSAGVEPLEFEGDHEDEGHSEEEGEAPAEEEGEHGDEHAGADPHVWFDVHNVEQWSENIAASLRALDPANAERYEANAATYRAELEALNKFIHEAVEGIPEANRKLVTNHDTFQYFARAYGFEVVGTVIPSFNTDAEPSASDLSNLIQVVQAEAVPAIFIETTVNEQLADVVAEETGTGVYELYTDALGPAGSGADSYIGMVRANVETLADALAE